MTSPIRRKLAWSHGDHVGDAEARTRAGPRARRGSRSRAARRRGPRRGRGGERSAAPTCTSTVGRVVAAADRPAAHARPRVRRHRRRDRRDVRHVAGRRLRLGREPRHLRHVLPLPHRPRAHVRADADPRRRPRRRLRRVRRRAGVGDLAERPREAAARDRDAAGAVRQRRLRDERRRISRGARSPSSAAARSGSSAIAIARASPAPPRASPPTARRSGSALAEHDGRGRDVNVDETADDVAAWFLRAERGHGIDVVFEMSGAVAGDRRRVPDRAQRRPRDPVRHPVAPGRDRRRRVADLQEPRRARRQRPRRSSRRGTGRAGCSRAASSTCGR